MRIEPNKQLVALYRYAFKCSVVAFIFALVVMQLYFESGDASLFLDEVSMPLILTIIVAVLFQSAFVVLCWLGIVGYPVFQVSKVFKLNRNATVMISLLVSI